MNETTAQIALFFGVAALAFLAMLFTYRPRESASEENASLDSLEAQPSAFTRLLAACIPMSRQTERELRDELVTAGDYRAHALEYFNANRTMLILAPLVLANVALLALPEKSAPAILIVGAVLAVLGYSVPRAVIVARGKRRTDDVERGLPFAVDLLTMSVGAGQNLVGGVRRVAKDIRSSYPVLGNELALAARQAELRSLPYALEQWADRLKAPSVRNLALVLLHSEQLGASTSASLEEFAASLRTQRRLRAEARGNRLSFWMLIPTIFCLWTSVALLLVGPAWAMISDPTAIREAMSPDGTSASQTAAAANNPVN